MAEQTREQENRFCNDILNTISKPLGAVSGFQAWSLLSSQHREYAVCTLLRDTSPESANLQQNLLLRLLAKTTQLPDKILAILRVRLKQIGDPWLFLTYHIALLPEAKRLRLLETFPNPNNLLSLGTEALHFTLQIIAVCRPSELGSYLLGVRSASFYISDPLAYVLRPDLLTDEMLISLLTLYKNTPPKSWQMFLKEHQISLEKRGILRKLEDYAQPADRLGFRVWFYAVLPERRVGNPGWQEEIRQYLLEGTDALNLLELANPDAELKRVLASCSYEYALLPLPKNTEAFIKYATKNNAVLNKEMKFALFCLLLGKTNWNMLSQTEQTNRVFEFITGMLLALPKARAKNIVPQTILPLWGENLFGESYPAFRAWIAESACAGLLGQQDWFHGIESHKITTMKERVMWVFFLASARHPGLETQLTALLLDKNGELKDFVYHTWATEVQYLLAFALPDLSIDFAQAILNKLLHRINISKFVAEAFWFARTQNRALEDMYQRLPKTAQTAFFDELAKIPGLRYEKLEEYRKNLGHECPTYQNPLAIEPTSPENRLEKKTENTDIAGLTRLLEARNTLPEPYSQWLSSALATEFGANIEEQPPVGMRL